MIRTYSELLTFNTFIDRFNYLKLTNAVGESTFGFDRYLNQVLYHSADWYKTRDKVIYRDNACDLALPGYEIIDKLYIHHMNPVTIQQIESNSPAIFEPEFLVCVSHRTHLAIHYGNEKLLPKVIVRKPGDTKLW